MSSADRGSLREAAERGDPERARRSATHDAESRAAVARSEGRTVPAEEDYGAAVHLANAALIALDPVAARDSLAVLDRLSAPAALADAQLVALLLARSSAQLVLGVPTDDDPLRPESVRARLDSTLLHLLQRDVAGAADALSIARRLTRMARTEGDRDALVIAGAQLARQRRLAGFPHLASRILHQVTLAGRSRWDAWIAWERLMTGGRALEPSFDSAAWREVERLRRLLAGEAVTAAPPPPWPPWARDWERARFVSGALGSDVTDPSGALRIQHGPARPCGANGAPPGRAQPRFGAPCSDPVLAAWGRGETHGVPHGLVALAEVQGDAPAAWVVAEAGAPGARRLRRGSPPTPELVVTSTRTQTALAELALRGPRGVDVETFFRSVYGFRYVQSRHRASLDVLFHRVRTALPEGARFQRQGDVVYLHHMGLSLPDPRTVVGPEESLLAAIAERSTASARDLADALQIPLRSVQRILHVLASEGVCQVQGRGPATQYHIEDTTFADPTALRAS